MARRGMYLTCNEGNAVSHGDDSLSCKHFAGNHGILAELPFPYHESGDQENSDDKLCNDIGTAPGMRVSSGLEGNQSASLSQMKRT